MSEIARGNMIWDAVATCELKSERYSKTMKFSNFLLVYVFKNFKFVGAATKMMTRRSRSLSVHKT